jgi:hypothetical protein
MLKSVGIFFVSIPREEEAGAIHQNLCGHSRIYPVLPYFVFKTNKTTNWKQASVIP